MSKPELVLHQHPFAAFCWKALIALHDLELAFESRIVEGEEGRRELARIWPMASIPVLVDESAGLTLPSSSAIVEYADRLASRAGRLIPPDGEDALQARLWDRIADDYVATPMQAIVADSLRSGDDHDPTGVQQARATLDTAYGLFDDRLRDETWAGGAAFTIADCAAAPALFYARVVHPWDEDGLPRLTRYYGALMHRPSVRRVIDDARPYRHLFPLAWPENVDAHQPSR